MAHRLATTSTTTSLLPTMSDNDNDDDDEDNDFATANTLRFFWRRLWQQHFVNNPSKIIVSWHVYNKWDLSCLENMALQIAEGEEGKNEKEKEYNCNVLQRLICNKILLIARSELCDMRGERGETVAVDYKISKRAYALLLQLLQLPNWQNNPPPPPSLPSPKLKIEIRTKENEEKVKEEEKEEKEKEKEEAHNNILLINTYFESEADFERLNFPLYYSRERAEHPYWKNKTKIQDESRRLYPLYKKQHEDDSAAAVRAVI